MDSLNIYNVCVILYDLNALDTALCLPRMYVHMYGCSCACGLVRVMLPMHEPVCTHVSVHDYVCRCSRNCTYVNVCFNSDLLWVQMYACTGAYTCVATCK